MQNSEHSKQLDFGPLKIQWKPLTLTLRQTFNTAHSSSETRVNFFVKILCDIQGRQIRGFGESGLPPKKTHCYLADFNDCSTFMQQIERKSIDFLKVSRIDCNKSVFQQESFEKYGFFNIFNTESEALDHKTRYGQYGRIIQYLERLLFGGKTVSQNKPCFLAARSGLEFAILDFASGLLEVPVQEIVGGRQLLQKVQKQKSTEQLAIGNNKISFYTVSHSEDLNSMLENAQKHASVTEYIKIKFDNDIDKLIQLLVLFDSKGAGQKWIIDANASWTAENFTNFEMQLKSNPKHSNIFKKVLFVEQPFPIFDQSTSDLTENQKWRHIFESTSLTIIADESFSNAESLSQVCQYSHGVNIKMEKCGGPFQAVRILSQLSEFPSKKVMFGCMVSTHLGCTQTFQFNQFAKYFDLDGSLLVGDPEVAGGFEWRGKDGIVLSKCIGLVRNMNEIFQSVRESEK